jgi:palmitoyltransferase
MAGVGAKDKTSPREHATPRGNVFQVALRRAIRDMVRIVDASIDYGARFFHIVVKILGPCLICLALSLIGFVTYTFFVHALPNMKGTAAEQSALSSIGIFLVTNAVYNYGRSVCSDPGTPPEWKEMTDLVDESDAPKPRQCGKCKRVKPTRAHHCSVCRRCVLKMDHHCPWINNCVGFRNYRNFCLFMLFLAASCFFVVVVFFVHFNHVILHVGRTRFQVPRPARSCITTSFMICCSILVALGILGGFHVWLVLTNQTTIEFHSNMMRRKEARKNGEYYRNPYDLGRTRNFQQVFGPNPFCRFRWLLSMISPGPTGDGMDFPSMSVRGL